MNLWWYYTQYTNCSFSEIQKRSSVPFGWSEIGALDRYVKDKPNWERQFKTFVQVKGDIAFNGNTAWQTNYRQTDRVPDLFWQMLQIKKDDLIICIESGNSVTMGKPFIAGISQATVDGIKSYQFDDKFKNSHNVCSGLLWSSWNLNTPQDFPMPKEDFLILKQDNSLVRQAHDVWLQLNEQLIKTTA